MGKKETAELTTRVQMARLWKIVAIVQNEKKITARKLAEHFEVSVRTIRRDLDFLRDQMGIEINWDADEHTYLLDPDFTHIPPLELGEDDFLLLSYLQQCISQHSDTDIGRMMNASFKKIFGLLTGTKRWAEFAQHIHFRFDECLSASSRREDKIFRILYRAIRDRKVVSFDYKPMRQPTKSYTVEPSLVLMHKGRWYCYGRVAGRKHIHLFAFARIENLKASTLSYLYNDDEHDPRRLLRHSFGVAISSDPVENVVLEFDPKVAQRVKENHWHPDQELADLPNGGLRLTLPLNTTLEISPWILTWGPYAKVVSPPELAAKIADTLKRMLANYDASHSVSKAT
jgi:proteasome accessory factor B